MQNLSLSVFQTSLKFQLKLTTVATKTKIEIKQQPKTLA